MGQHVEYGIVQVYAFTVSRTIVEIWIIQVCVPVAFSETSDLYSVLTDDTYETSVPDDGDK
jgi:hypothetical protein